MFTKYCTVEQKNLDRKNGRSLKPSSNKRARHHKKQKNTKTIVTNNKNVAKNRAHTRRYNSHLEGPAIRTCSFASPARTAHTTRTKRKRRRNEADFPVTKGRTSRPNSPKPPIWTHNGFPGHGVPRTGFRGYGFPGHGGPGHGFPGYGVPQVASSPPAVFPGYGVPQAGFGTGFPNGAPCPVAFQSLESRDCHYCHRFDAKPTSCDVNLV